MAEVNSRLRNVFVYIADRPTHMGQETILNESSRYLISNALPEYCHILILYIQNADIDISA